MKPRVECGRPAERGKRRCTTCRSRIKRARDTAWLAGRNPYEVALEAPKFCARLDARVAAESVIDPKTGCRIWTGGKAGIGYGKINFRSTIPLVVHRLIAIRAGKAKPEDPETLHSCDTPACIEPEHLSGGTRAQNTRDMAARSRQPLGVSGLRGVTLDTRRKTPRWRASMRVAGKDYHIGVFADPEMAAARVIGVRKYLGLIAPE